MPAEKLDIVIERRKLSDLKALEKNAHYLEKNEFDTLVANIKRDGCLTSLPVIYDYDVPGEILSGNHRVKAALKAGLVEADVIIIKSKISQDQKTGVILSHNSIKGKDDPNVLKELYDSIISLDFKAYSGLTDDAFKVPELELVPLSFQQEPTQDVMVSFLAADKQVFLDNVERIGKYAKKHDVMTAEISAFDDFAEAMFKIKSEFQIINTALALKVMSELALERIAELGDENAAED